MILELSNFEILVLVLCALFAVVYLRALFAGLDRVVPRYRPRPAIELESELLEEEISAETERNKIIAQKVTRLSQANPERIASVINKWLLENGW